MKSAAILGFALVGAAVAPAEASLRSYAEVNEIVKQRLLEPGSAFELGQYLGESYSDKGSSLLDLLGTYKGEGLDSKLKNGTANSANMLLWHFLMASLARDVSKECTGRAGIGLREEFQSAVRNACRWPAPASRSPEAMEEFWTLVMGYDAPYSEFLAWRDFIRNADFANPGEAVFSMLLAITSNPHFLLGN